MKNQKGITLIALVITIIVLLILAGVSIALLTGENGLLSRAQEAGKSNLAGELEEAAKLAVTELELAKYTDETKPVVDIATIKAAIDKTMGLTTTVTGNDITATRGDSATITVTITEGKVTSIVKK